jgi:hypothetical protein
LTLRRREFGRGRYSLRYDAQLTRCCFHGG